MVPLPARAQIVRVVWPQYEPGLSAYTTAKLQASLDRNLPDFVESLPIKRLSFGSSPPQLDAIRLMYARRLEAEAPATDVRAVRARAVLDLDVRMQCAGDAVLVVRLGSRHVRVSVPLTISDVAVRGRLRLELIFATPWPWFARLHLAWAELPHVECSVRPVRSVDMMEMPGLSTWLHEAIEGAVRTMVWPLKLCLPYEEWYGTAQPQTEAQTEAQPAQPHGGEPIAHGTRLAHQPSAPAALGLRHRTSAALSLANCNLNQGLSHGLALGAAGLPWRQQHAVQPAARGADPELTPLPARVSAPIVTSREFLQQPAQQQQPGAQAREARGGNGEEEAAACSARPRAHSAGAPPTPPPTPHQPQRLGEQQPPHQGAADHAGDALAAAAALAAQLGSEGGGGDGDGGGGVDSGGGRAGAGDRAGGGEAGRERAGSGASRGGSADARRCTVDGFAAERSVPLSRRITIGPPARAAPPDAQRGAGGAGTADEDDDDDADDADEAAGLDDEAHFRAHRRSLGPSADGDGGRSRSGSEPQPQPLPQPARQPAAGARCSPVPTPLRSAHRAGAPVPATAGSADGGPAGAPPSSASSSSSAGRANKATAIKRVLTSAGRHVRKLATNVKAHQPRLPELHRAARTSTEGGRSAPASPCAAPACALPCALRLLNVHVLEASAPPPSAQGVPSPQDVWLTLAIAHSADADRQPAQAVASRVPPTPRPIWSEHFTLPLRRRAGGHSPESACLQLRLLAGATAARTRDSHGAEGGTLLGASAKASPCCSPPLL